MHDSTWVLLHVSVQIQTSIVSGHLNIHPLGPVECQIPKATAIKEHSASFVQPLIAH